MQLNFAEIAELLTAPMSYEELRAKLNYPGNITSPLGILLSYLVAIFPEKYAIINDILYGPDSSTNSPARNPTFTRDIKLRDGKCVISGRYANRCEVAHIYEFKDCKDSGDRYDINNGLLLDAGLHKLWDDGEIMLEPVGDSQARFIINPYSMANANVDIPELIKPVMLDVNCRMMYFIKKRFAGRF